MECIIFQDLSFEISINDITQEEEQVRLKRQLTQNIAHELKTPVSSIQGYLETIVNNENIAPEKMQVFLERCYAQSNRLSRLLRDISVLTRMDEAANMIDMEKVDISMLVSNIVNEVSLELEQKQITVVNSLNRRYSCGATTLYSTPSSAISWTTPSLMPAPTYTSTSVVSAKTRITTISVLPIPASAFLPNI